MSERLKILYGQDRAPYPYFTTEELAELWNCGPRTVKSQAKREGWASFEVKEKDPDEDDFFSYQAWDALSMPAATRQRIAFCHYLAEQEEQPLLREVDVEARRIIKFFPAIKASVLVAALYRARQLGLIRDVAVSLRLSVDEAVEAVCAAIGKYRDMHGGRDSGLLRLSFDRIMALIRHFDTDTPGDILTMDEDVRFCILLQYFSQKTGNLASEFSGGEIYSSLTAEDLAAEMDAEVSARVFALYGVSSREKTSKARSSSPQAPATGMMQ